jgi:uncharacterized protein (TIGR03067 family)
MIVWTGWGILAGVFWAVGLLLTQLAVDAACGPDYYTGHAWPKVLGSAVAAPAIWAAGRALNGSPHSEQRQLAGAGHTLFFVPMEYWAPIFIGLGVLFGLLSDKAGDRAATLHNLTGQLQGKWVAVRGEHQGQAIQDPDNEGVLRQYQLVFRGGSFALNSPNMTAKGTYRIDASTRPLRMRLLTEDGEEMAAVFELREGQLHFCATAPGAPSGQARRVRRSPSCSASRGKDNREGTPPLVRLRALCGPGDEGEPVITVMLHDED